MNNTSRLNFVANKIDEISMVSSELVSFLSNLFGSLHKNHKVFGGIPVLVVGDFLQLPPVNGEQVFYSLAWKLFFPLLLPDQATATKRRLGFLQFT